jgi:hypothetical protein
MITSDAWGFRHVSSLVGLMAIGLNGCGEEAPVDGLEVGDPRFALNLAIVDANLETSSFVVFTDDLDSGSIALGNALELGGNASVHGLPGGRTFYATSQERSDVTKYQIEDGLVRESGRALLSGLGVQLFGEVMIFDGPDRGYILDLLSQQIVELDLEAMEIVRTIDASALADPMQPTFLSRNETVRRGDEVVLATYATDLQQETVSDVSQIVFFDPGSGTFERRPAPCGGLTHVRAAANGDIFFSNDPWGAGIHGISPSQGPAPCLARLPAGSRNPDPAPVMLNELTGRPTGGFIPSGDSTVYLRVLDTETLPITSETSAAQLFGARGWETFEIDLTQPTSASRISNNTLAVGGITYFDIGGAVYESQSTANFESTVLLRTTGPGAPAPGLETPGIVFDIVRLR